MFEPDGQALLRALVAVPLLYFVLVVFVRFSGRRTTSQMNNFDWIVTVALGSMIATGILSREISLLTVLLAISLILAVQYAITWLVIRSSLIRRLVKATPRLLVYQGQMLTRDLRIERISELEVLAAVRAAGHHSLSEVHAVVLETDATMSVLPRVAEGRASGMLDDVDTASCAI